MNLELAAAFVRFNLLDHRALITCALENLEKVGQSDSLVLLAGFTGDSLEEAYGLFEKSLRELSIPKPAEKTAALMVAGHYAEKILTGELSAYDGACRIWKDVCLNVDGMDELNIFVGGASEIEDLPLRYADKPKMAQKYIASFEAEIREAAARLVRSQKKIPASDPFG